MPVHWPAGAVLTLGSGVGVAVGVGLAVGDAVTVAVTVVCVAVLGEEEGISRVVGDVETTAAVQPARRPAAASPTTKRPTDAGRGRRW